MVHSVELLLDADSDAAVREIWTRLANAGLPSRAANTSPSNRPHVSLVVAARIGADVDAPLARVAAMLPLSCVLGAPLLFGGSRLTVARLVVPSPRLLALQSACHDVCLPSAPFSHTAPGNWTPHVTLCRRMNPAQLAQAVAQIDGLGGDLPAELVGLRRWDGDERVDYPIG